MARSESLAMGTAAAHRPASRTLRSARRVAWSLWALAVAAAALAVLLGALNGVDVREAFAQYLASTVLSAVAFATLGALVGSRRPEHPIGWLFCATGVGAALTAFVRQYAEYAVLTRPGAPGGMAAVWLNPWIFVLGMVLPITYLLLLYPDGRLPSARWRPAVWLIAVAGAVLAVALALHPTGQESLPGVRNPLGLEGADDLLSAATTAGDLLVLVGVLAGVGALVSRFRRARGDERLQLTWFAYAGAVALVALSVRPVLDLLGLFRPEMEPWTGGLGAVAIQGLPLAAALAILRYRLYDIDLLINRSLAYGTLTASVAGIYIFVVVYLGAIFRVKDNLLVSLVATAIVAVLFAPLREGLQRGVNRLLYGERDEPYAVLARLGRRLEATLAPEAVLPAIAGTVREALKLSYAAIALPRGDAFTVVAAAGEPVAQPSSLPLTYQGETVGRLLFGPRAPGEEFSAADRRLLEALASQAGVAVHGVRVMTDLQRSRERIVLAREEERRRLRRDLHDVLAPTLAALGLTAATVGELIPRDPDKAAAVNAKLEAALRGAVGDVRRLVYDLRPPALDELGLVAALRERADQLSSGATGLAVTVEVPEPLPPLPAAVEVAAYRIVQEALNNVARHARARHSVVRLEHAPQGWLLVEVVDDGVGLQPGYQAGVGLRSMAERVAELSGTWNVARREPSGTRVLVRLPVTRENGDGV